MIPLLAIVVVFVRTMGARKLSEHEGRILKLVSGYMMAGFGLLLLAAPQLLSNPLASMAVLLVAVGAAFVTARLAAPLPAPTAGRGGVPPTGRNRPAGRA